jgi:type 1 glutamine amidotransferase
MRIANLATAAPWCAASVWPADYPLKELTAEEKAAIGRAIPAKGAKPRKARKVLVVHIAKRNGKPVRGHPSIPYGNCAFIEMGKRTGAYRAVIDNHETVFQPDNLKAYDLIVFNDALGVLFDDPALRQSLLDFVKNGKGFAGIHTGGGATFVQYPVYDHFPEFGVMVGGCEDGGHPWSPNDVTYVKIDDPKSPLTAMFKGPFEIHDETFQFREPSLRERLHVLISIGIPKMEMGPNHRLLKQRQGDLDFPIGWIKSYGMGRVFYATTGHNPGAFKDPLLLQHYLAGIQFAMGDGNAGMTPSEKAEGPGK